MNPPPKRAARPSAFTFSGATAPRAPEQPPPSPVVATPERLDAEPPQRQDAQTPKRPEVQKSRSRDPETSGRRDTAPSRRTDVKKSGDRDVQGSPSTDGETSGRQDVQRPLAYTWRITPDDADRLDDLVRATRRRLGLRRLDRASVLQGLVDAAISDQAVRAALDQQLQGS